MIRATVDASAHHVGLTEGYFRCRITSREFAINKHVECRRIDADIRARIIVQHVLFAEAGEAGDRQQRLGKTQLPSNIQIERALMYEGSA